MNYSTDFRSIRDGVSAQEWQTRIDLAACYRLVDHYGMSDLIYNHITARIPGTEHLLINLYGLLYKEITASSLVKIDLEGNIVWKPNADYGINVSGYVIHGAIHKARTDVACVLHTHTRAGMAVAAMQCGLLPLSQTAMRFVGHIGLHDYEGPAIDLGGRERIVGDLGPHDALIMRNHGLLTCGATIQQAFNTMYQLELSCRTQVDAMAARPNWQCRAQTYSPIQRIYTSRARGGLMACSNGRRCSACSRRSSRVPLIRHIGVKLSARGIRWTAVRQIKTQLSVRSCSYPDRNKAHGVQLHQQRWQPEERSVCRSDDQRQDGAFAYRRRASQGLIDRVPGRSGRGLARSWEEGFPSAAVETPTGLLRRSRGLIEGNQMGCGGN